MRKFLWGLNSLLVSGLVVMLYVGFKELPETIEGDTHSGLLNGLIQGSGSAIAFFIGAPIFIAGLLLVGTFRSGFFTEWMKSESGPFPKSFRNNGRSAIRWLIVVELGLTAIAGLMSYGESSLLSEYPDARNAISDDVTLHLGGIWLLIFLVSRIGILFLWAPAREIYLCSELVGLLLTPFLGTSISGPWTELYEGALMILSGFILCFIYLTPAREAFRRTGDQKTQAHQGG